MTEEPREETVEDVSLRSGTQQMERSLRIQILSKQSSDCDTQTVVSTRVLQKQTAAMPQDSALSAQGTDPALDGSGASVMTRCLHPHILCSSSHCLLKKSAQIPTDEWADSIRLLKGEFLPLKSKRSGRMLRKK